MWGFSCGEGIARKLLPCQEGQQQESWYIVEKTRSPFARSFALSFHRLARHLLIDTQNNQAVSKFTGMSNNNYGSSAGSGFKHERPGHSSPLFLPFLVSTDPATPRDIPRRVLLTVAETRGGYALSLDAEIPNVLDLNSETKWRQVDALLDEAGRWKRVFAGFPDTLNTSLEEWRDSAPEGKLQDVLSYLEDNKDVIPSKLRGSFLAIGTEQAARNNEHSICFPKHRIGGIIFDQAQVRQLDYHLWPMRSYC